MVQGTFYEGPAGETIFEPDDRPDYVPKNTISSNEAIMSMLIGAVILLAILIIIAIVIYFAYRSNK